MAGLAITIDTTRFAKEAKEELDALLRKADVVIEANMGDTVADAVTLVPVDTGFLKNSINYTRVAALQYEYFAAEFYAPFIEFGTGKGLSIPNGYEGLARSSGDAGIAKGRALFGYKGGKRNPNIRARPYFIPAWERFKARLIDNLNKL